MRTAAEIYEAYRIPPWLQEHQYRVAAVGALIARAAGIDESAVILTGLFHDMGNILKIDLSPERKLSDLVDSADVPQWKAVQNEYRAKYGDDEHRASMAIAVEIGLSDDVRGMIDNMRFVKTEWILREGSMEMKIIKYADLRVAPHGILSLDGRLAEARERYRGKAFDKGETYTPESLAATEEMCRELEHGVLAAAGIPADSLNDTTAAPVIEELKKYAIS